MEQPIRIMHLVNQETNEERIQFTEDLQAPVADFLPHDFTVVSDTTVRLALPAGFPSNHEFQKLN
jgi:dihydroneopterin aldolase